MNYCSHCGARVSLRIPEGDSLPRYVCDSCHTIHYQNPKMVIGCIPQWEDKILLCRRAIEPRHGFWTLPAGFMENSETTTQAAARETLEEAQAMVEIGALYCLFNVPHISQVHLFFQARMLQPHFGAGVESLEVKLFTEQNLPWDEIAFATVRRTLQLFVTERQSGTFGFHMGDIHPAANQQKLYSSTPPNNFIP
ncbi:MAG: NUDIX hydrolase [Gammaproteobacteria bacterium]|nr:NUDIX hydrolase [Gammaproteobacteria bacterium]MBU1732836.1 NUDIX hydrolase [Gammaproteobacteria bacterium]MBU1891661.1 NUDIX hydrolase [Gammaproteobacteria bacterium]